MYIAEKYNQLVTLEGELWVANPYCIKTAVLHNPAPRVRREKRSSRGPATAVFYGKAEGQAQVSFLADWLQCCQLGPCCCTWKPHRPAIRAEAQLRQEVCLGRLWQPHQAVEVSGLVGFSRGRFLPSTLPTLIHPQFTKNRIFFLLAHKTLFSMLEDML